VIFGKSPIESTTFYAAVSVELFVQPLKPKAAMANPNNRNLFIKELLVLVG
jgi:hypothetical protein